MKDLLDFKDNMFVIRISSGGETRISYHECKKETAELIRIHFGDVPCTQRAFSALEQFSCDRNPITSEE